VVLWYCKDVFDFARHLNGEFACMADLNGYGEGMLCGRPHWGAITYFVLIPDNQIWRIEQNGY